MLDKELVYRFQIIAGRHVHDGQVLVIELPMRRNTVGVSLDQMFEHPLVRLDMPVGVHRHERRQLHKSRIDPAERARMPGRHGRHQVLLEPSDRVLLRELRDRRGRRPRVDRPAHERHAARLAILPPASEQADGRHHGWRGLTHGDDVSVRAQMPQKADNRVDVIREPEFAGRLRHDPCVTPVGHIDLMVGVHQVLRRAAQQRCVMAAHGGNKQHARPGRVGTGEPQQADKRLIQFDRLGQRRV